MFLKTLIKAFCAQKCLKIWITFSFFTLGLIHGEQSDLNTVFSKKYKTEIIPPTHRGMPITVNFGMTVIDINSINVEDRDFRLDMFLRQEWTDPRIKVPEELFHDDDFIVLPSQYFESLWQPDLYFSSFKAVEIATLTHTYSSIILFRNKTVRYSARMYAIVACQMEFQHYPIDTQICPVSVESFSYDVKRMKLKWANGGVTLSPELKLLQYDVGEIRLEETTVLDTDKIGNFSRLIAYFRFEREIGHHLIQTYAPSTLIVVISWFSFWIGLDAVPGRVTLLITCLLTLVTMFTDLRDDTPAVAYIKALDLWMAGCMLFVFAALGEFVVVKVSCRYYEEKKKQQRNSIMEQTVSGWDSRKNLLLLNTPKSKNGFLKHSWIAADGNEKILWLEIDKTSAVVFPILFFVFVAVYWSILLWVQSDR